MRLVVRTARGEEQVEVERQSEAYEVRVGERSYRVEAASLGDGHASLLVAGRQHEVRARYLGEGAYAVTGAGTVEVVEVADPLAHLAGKTRASVRPAGRQQVRAMMPGRVVAILGGEGDRVEAGQGVVVLEAMKMENEISSEHPGTLRRIHVEPGQAVERGDPLFEIE
jgi:pyruvate carboxylase subunit B